MTARPRAPRIPVPDGVVRDPDAILAGADVYVDPRGGVWVTCHNCGGTTMYPSSMIPAGRCRFYCWAGPMDPVARAMGATPPERTGPTRGRRPVGDVETYVRREQARDRAAYRARIRADAAAAAAAATRAARLADPDPRLVDLVDAYGVEGLWLGSDPDAAPTRARLAMDLVGAWLGGAELTVAQWDLVELLREQEAARAARDAAEAARRAASRWIGTAGERLELEVTVEAIVRITATDFYGRPEPRVAVRMRDDHGNALIWWTAYAPAELAAAAGLMGQRVRIRGTVKRHDEYRGEAQTTMTRVRVLAAAGVA